MKFTDILSRIVEAVRLHDSGPEPIVDTLSVRVTAGGVCMLYLSCRGFTVSEGVPVVQIELAKIDIITPMVRRMVSDLDVAREETP